MKKKITCIVLMLFWYRVKSKQAAPSNSVPYSCWSMRSIHAQVGSLMIAMSVRVSLRWNLFGAKGESNCRKATCDICRIENSWFARMSSLIAK